MALRIKNRDARRLWLQSHGLSPAPTGAIDVLQIINKLGFVQLDSIRNVTRAHHHILWSRNQNYREPMLWKALSEDRKLFEHFTHDASLIPMEFYPMWQKRFARFQARLRGSKYYAPAMQPDLLSHIQTRIHDEGALSTRAFNTKISGKKQMWSRPPHKLALDYLWYIGDLTTSHRENFTKFYDLPHRIVPKHLRARAHSTQAQTDWLCAAALDRLGFATPMEIAKFWDAVESQEAVSWIQNAANHLVNIQVQADDGSWHNRVGAPDIESRLTEIHPATSRLRIINPFDPAIRDRDRLQKLFGFSYKNEIFVPAAARIWGYYVYPLLEGDRFIGRIELSANRKAGQLQVKNLWAENGVKWTAGRWRKLTAELQRLAKMIGCVTVEWDCPSIPTSQP